MGRIDENKKQQKLKQMMADAEFKQNQRVERAKEASEVARKEAEALAKTRPDELARMSVLKKGATMSNQDIERAITSRKYYSQKGTTRDKFKK